jgi:hypothetical protein
VTTGEKLHKNDFRFVEKLLYDQKTHDTAIAELEAEMAEILENLLPGGTGSYVDMTTAKGQPEFTQPEAWAIKREENLRVKDLRQEITRRCRRNTCGHTIRSCWSCLRGLGKQVKRMAWG